MTVKILPQNSDHDSSHHQTSLWWESSRGRQIETRWRSLRVVHSGTEYNFTSVQGFMLSFYPLTVPLSPFPLPKDSAIFEFQNVVMDNTNPPLQKAYQRASAKSLLIAHTKLTSNKK